MRLARYVPGSFASAKRFEDFEGLLDLKAQAFNRRRAGDHREEMSSVVNVLAASVTTFAATNLDDIFLLTVFFARRVPTRRIVAGQYLGFAAAVVVSFALVWCVSLSIPRGWTRILGILPLAIGVKELVHIHRLHAIHAERAAGSLSVLSIAVITLANGADKVGVDVPFFVASRTHLQLVLVVYGLLVLVWCAVGKWFARHGSLDYASCADRAGRLYSTVHVTATVRAEQQDLAHGGNTLVADQLTSPVASGWLHVAIRATARFSLEVLTQDPVGRHR